MSQAVAFVAGVPVALAGAAAFGAASVLQYRATHRVPERGAGRPRLFVDLVRVSGWRWSIALSVLGFALQVLALRLAPLVLVQPLLVTGVLWYVLLAAAAQRRRVDRIIVIGTVLCVLGLSAFLVVADPGGARGVRPGLRGALPLGIGLLTTVALCLLASATVARRWRALPLALATGVCYGVTATLVSALSGLFGLGIGVVVGQWETYVIAVLAPFGVLLSQNAYQSGRIGAPALAIITVTDPLVAIAAGTVWLGESVNAAPLALAGESAGLVALCCGVVLLASRAPHVAPTAPEPASARSTPRAGIV